MTADVTVHLPHPARLCANILTFARGNLAQLQSKLHSVVHSLHAGGLGGVQHIQGLVSLPGRSASSSTKDSSAELKASQASIQNAVTRLEQHGQQLSPGPVTREDLGRSTWLLLHTLAAQYPGRPSKQQRKDVNALVHALDPEPPAILFYISNALP